MIHEASAAHSKFIKDGFHFSKPSSYRSECDHSFPCRITCWVPSKLFEKLRFPINQRESKI